jgi:hypothetical protein
MNRRVFASAVMVLLSVSVTVSAQGFGSGNQELTPRGLILLILVGIFVLYKLLGSRL